MLACSHLEGANLSGNVQVTQRLTKKRFTPLVSAYARGVPVQPAGADEVEPSLRSEYTRIAVYIENPSGAAPVPVTVSLDQKDQRFESDLMVVPVGSAVLFPNRDPIFHNVFSLSGVKSFDLGNYKRNESRTVTFPKAGVVPVYCHLHPNMSAAIVVTPGKWGMKPAADGNYEFAGVPAGRYRIVAWHRTAGYFRKEVELREGQTVTLNFTIPIDRKSPPNP